MFTKTFAQPTGNRRVASRLAALGLLSVALGAVAPTAQASEEPVDSLSRGFSADWLARGHLDGVPGNTHRAYIVGDLTTTERSSEQFASGAIESFICPKGVNPPMYYSWSEGPVRTRCSYVGYAEFQLDDTTLTVTDELRSANLKGRASLVVPDSDVTRSFPIDLTVSGRGAITRGSETYRNDEGRPVTNEWAERSAKASGTFGSLGIDRNSSSRDTRLSSYWTAYN